MSSRSYETNDIPNKTKCTYWYTIYSTLYTHQITHHTTAHHTTTHIILPHRIQRFNFSSILRKPPATAYPSPRINIAIKNGLGRRRGERRPLLVHRQ